MVIMHSLHKSFLFFFLYLVYLICISDWIKKNDKISLDIIKIYIEFLIFDFFFFF